MTLISVNGKNHLVTLKTSCFTDFDEKCSTFIHYAIVDASVKIDGKVCTVSVRGTPEEAISTLERAVRSLDNE